MRSTQPEILVTAKANVLRQRERHEYTGIDITTLRAIHPTRLGFLGLVLVGLWIFMPSVSEADQQMDPALGPLLQRALQAGECFEDRYERAVWFAAMEPKLRKAVVDEAERTLILEQVQCEAKRLKLPPGLIMAVIDIESGFNRWAVSSAGAVGLMQVMPFWPRKLGLTNDQLVRVPQNIRMGATILKYYLDRERGDYTRALARYNGSVGRRNYSDQVLGRLANRWQYR